LDTRLDNQQRGGDVAELFPSLSPEKNALGSNPDADADAGSENAPPFQEQQQPEAAAAAPSPAPSPLKRSSSSVNEGKAAAAAAAREGKRVTRRTRIPAYSAGLSDVTNRE